MELKFAELIKMNIKDVETYQIIHPDNIAADNALRELKRQEKTNAKLKKYAKKHAVVNGMTRNKYSASMNRVPTKRDLR